MRALTLFTAVMLCSLLVSAQDVVGQWKTIDDDSGKPRSIVEIYKEGGKLYGKIVKLFRGPGEEQDPLCDECEGAKHNQRIIGMVIIEDMEFDADDQEWEDGTILDPENGTDYDCKIWLDDENPDRLKVRGYVAFFYRTQTWIRVS